MKFRMILALNVVFSLVACSGPSTTTKPLPTEPVATRTATPTSQPTVTRTPFHPASQTPFLTSTLSATQRPSEIKIQEALTPAIPTSKPNPEKPTFPTKTSQATRTPVPTIPAETLAVWATMDAGWNACEGAERPQGNALSPDGAWMAIVCDPNHNIDTYTKVFRLDGTQAWDVPFYETFGVTQRSKNEPEGIHSGAMNIEHWTIDSQYLYLVPSVRYFDGNCMDFYSGPALYRLDLSNGNISTTLQPASSFWDGYSYAFTSNDRYLAYVSPLSGNIVHIFNLATGKEKLVLLGDQFHDSGRFQWSPNTNKIAFTAGESDWCNTDILTVFVYDLDNNVLRTLVTNNLHHLRIKSWVSENEIVVGGSSTGERSDYVEFIINVDIGESIPVPTPLPTP